MLVLSGVFNTRILNARNYENQDYMRVNYTLNYCLLYAPGNWQPIKKCLMFLPGYGPIAITDWSIIVQCHLLVKHGLHPKKLSGGSWYMARTFERKSLVSLR
jgi:hypothetical protein